MAGSLLVVVVATMVSAIAVSTFDASGFDGWWRRPAPLFAATLVVAATAVALRRMPLPAPGEWTIVPRRPWHAFASRTLLWISGITATLLALNAVWQISIATTAPKDGPFFGNVPDDTDLPIYMSFNSGYGYLSALGGRTISPRSWRSHCPVSSFSPCCTRMPTGLCSPDRLLPVCARNES